MRPTGTVTLLFSDIDGSTRMLRSIGVQRYESALAQYRLLLRDAFARHAGYEVDLSGIVFWSALLERYLGRARAELAEDAANRRVGGRPAHRIRARDCAGVGAR